MSEKRIGRKKKKKKRKNERKKERELVGRFSLGESKGEDTARAYCKLRDRFLENMIMQKSKRANGESTLHLSPSRFIFPWREGKLAGKINSAC